MRIVDVAREQATGCGESDLRRLRRQFSTLKNTFLHYDVRETFIDGAAASNVHVRAQAMPTQYQVGRSADGLKSCQAYHGLQLPLSLHALVEVACAPAL